jgi:hypothetical protein
MNKNVSLRIPDNIYYSNPYAAVRSILGNDVQIININPSDVILNNNDILVNVDYKSIDFNSFKMYEIVETKILSNQSRETIATKVKDTITNEIIEQNIILYSDEIIDITPGKFIFIKYIDNVNYMNLQYYGEVLNVHNVLHSYCSIIDTQFLSYHGNDIPNVDVDYSSIKSEIDPELESKAYYKLLSISPNNYTNSNFDLSNIYSKFGYNNATLKTIDKYPTTKGIYIISNWNTSEFVNKHGILIVSKYRHHPLAIIFISSDSDMITKQNIDDMFKMLSYDLYNMRMLK